MKKISKKEAGRREWEYLKTNSLTDEELHVIRKLNGATSVPGHKGYSRRTIEAVLQGRRSNPPLLQQAIHNAKETLERYSQIMNKLFVRLSSSNGTTNEKTTPGPRSED
jgi:hypothetical protein